MITYVGFRRTIAVRDSTITWFPNLDEGDVDDMFVDDVTKEMNLV